MGRELKERRLTLENLEGQWFIIMSNFPMWLKGNKTHPTFNYSIIKKKGSTLLLDKVIYKKKYKEKSIIGFDKSINENNTEFIWKGKGILCLFKSKWKILCFNTKQQWAIIYFGKTLFTPKGYDVISRSKEISESVKKNILETFDTLDIKDKLQEINQS